MQKQRHKATAIVIDDSPVVSMILGDILRWADYKVIDRPENGADARKVIRRFEPEIVLLDQHLPDCKGTDLLREIKQHYPAIVVVMVSLECDPAIEREAMQLGAAGYINKPFTKSTVVAQLDQILDRIHFNRNVTDDSSFSSAGSSV